MSSVPARLATSRPPHSSSTSSSPATERSVDRAPGNCSDSTEIQHQLKKKDSNRDSNDRLRDLPEWLEEFTDSLQDTELPSPAHISHDSDSERPTSVASRKHHLKNSFPKRSKLRSIGHPRTVLRKWQKDQGSTIYLLTSQNAEDCDVCLRTKMTRAPCRRLAGEAAPRAEKVGDLTTTGHIVLNEEGEFRNNHRYAVVVQNLATQWIQCYPCQTKTSQETGKEFKKVSRAVRKAESHLH